MLEVKKNIKMDLYKGLLLLTSFDLNPSSANILF